MGKGVRYSILIALASFVLVLASCAHTTPFKDRMYIQSFGTDGQLVLTVNAQSFDVEEFASENDVTLDSQVQYIADRMTRLSIVLFDRTGEYRDYPANYGALDFDGAIEGNYSKAYSIASVLETLSAVMIPVATFAYNKVGITPLLAANAVCFRIAAIAETQIRAEESYIEQQKQNMAEQQSSGRQLLLDIKEGVQYLLGEKGLLAVAVYFTFSALAGGACRGTCPPARR